MRMYDLIKEKRDGGVLSDEEIRWMIDGYVKGEIPDYQMSAMLMAIYFQGMTDHETAVMTDAAAHSRSAAPPPPQHTGGQCSAIPAPAGWVGVSAGFRPSGSNLSRR